MGGINVGRWLAGGIAAGAFMWIVEGLATVLYVEEMQAVLEAHELAMMSEAGALVLSLGVSLIAGLTLIFFYAAARPRFGPGPKTAAIIGVAYWLGAYVLSLLGYRMLGLFPGDMLLLWATVGLVEIVLAAMLGGWIYREEPRAGMGATAEPAGTF